MEDASLELTIQMVDLEELARINPVAWEQLLHIVDNRQNAERIADLEAHLAQAHEVAKNDRHSQNGTSPVVTPA